jgi:hypothetical protein
MDRWTKSHLLSFTKKCSKMLWSYVICKKTYIINKKQCGRMRRWSNLRYYLIICQFRLRETANNLSQDSHVLLRFESIISQIQVGHVMPWANFHCRMHAPRGIQVNVSLFPSYGCQVTPSPEVNQILLSSMTHLLSPCFYITWHFANFAHLYPEMLVPTW